MKLNGRKPSGPNLEVVVIPRQPTRLEDGTEESNDIVFKCQAVLDYKEFEALVPRPEPMAIVRPGGSKNGTPDEDDPAYQELLARYGKRKMNWMILKSLSVTEGLEWERVDLQNPDTWELYEEELKEIGLTERERVEIIQTIFSVNSLTEKVFKEAKDRFLATQASRR